MTNQRIVELKHPSGARAEVYLYGATVTGFYTAKEPSRNVLFISEKSVMDGTKAIRGGIPLVFPVFGPHEGFPQHGFARIMDWTLSLMDQTVGDATSPTVATFTLHPNDESKALWPHEFELRYELKLFADTMITTLHVLNPSSTDISFQALLHTYLTVEDVRDRGCVVEGLKGVEYFNKLTQTSQIETNDVIAFDQETDRVYKNTPDKLVVHLGKENTAGPRYVITITKEGLLHHGAHQEKQLTDAVVWNPWINKSKAMVDFGDEEYITMVCVEPGRVSEKQTVGPGQRYTLQQTLHVSSL